MSTVMEQPVKPSVKTGRTYGFQVRRNGRWASVDEQPAKSRKEAVLKFAGMALAAKNNHIGYRIIQL